MITDDIVMRVLKMFGTLEKIKWGENKGDWRFGSALISQWKKGISGFHDH